MEGPRRGFSLKGSKENLPRYSVKRQTSLLMYAGQSLIYMEYTNITIFTTKINGTNHGVHILGHGAWKIGGGGG